jgi:hypothetical protein
MEQILSKLRSVELCLLAYPDNEEHSEFADRISDLQELQKEVNTLIEWKKSAINIFSEIDLQAIGKVLNIRLGQSVSKNLLSKIQLHSEKNRIEGVLLGLKICKEMFAQGQISHENIYENEIAYKDELSKLGVS